MQYALKTLTLSFLLKESVARYGHQLALAEVDGREYTYALLGERVLSLIKLLREQGVLAGDRVAILSENSPHWGIAYFAITSMGAVAVPILPEFKTAEVKHILRHSGAKAVFVSEQLLAKIEDEVPDTLRSIIRLENFATLPPGTDREKWRELLAEGGKGLDRLKDAAMRMTGLFAAEVKEDDLASIIYTSGTTGHSKGVMLTHKNVVFDAIATTGIIEISSSDRLLSILPLSHAYECTLGLVLPMMTGAAVYYLDRVPTARVLLPAMEKVKPTIMLSVPLVIEKIFKTKVYPALTRRALVRGLYRFPPLRKQLHKAAGKKLMHSFGGQLRSFCIGGAALAPEVEQFLREARFPYAIGYGLTETSPLAAGTDPNGTVLRSTGPPLPGVEIRIDQPNPATGEGEILVRGPLVMKGYYNDPGRTKEAFTKDGWFRTGDLGVFDDQGYLYIKGRVKNMILGPSGENIYPEEIEAVINQFEQVLESIVFQQNNHLLARVFLNYEELDKEFAVKKLQDSEIQVRIQALLEDIRLQANERVPNFARINKIIEQTEAFEKTPTQKIKRYLYV